MATKLVIEYVRSQLGDQGVLELLELSQTGYSEAELIEEHSWFSYELKHDLFSAAAVLLDDPRVARQIGASILDFKVATSLKLALRAFGSPQMVYQNAPRMAAKFQSTHSFEVVEAGEQSAKLRVRPAPGAQTRPADCDYLLGVFSTIPSIFGGPPAKIRHRICAAHGAEYCEYEISWERSAGAWRSSLLAGIGGAAVLTGGAALLGLPEFAYVATVGVPALAATGRGLLYRDRRQRRAIDELRGRFVAREDELVRLTASIREVISDLKIDEVLNNITRHASAAVDGTEYALLLDVGEGRLELASNVKLPQRIGSVLERWASGSRQWHSQIMEVEDVLCDPVLAPLADDADLPISSLCAAPLVFRGERLGLIVALSDQTEAFFQRDLELLTTFAAQAAAAIANARLYGQVEKRASHDVLTNLLNHRQFHQKLGQEIARSKRYASRVAVVLIDVDGFAALNDTLGHAEGDRVLRKVAEAISRSSRAADTAYRVGSDEFALILPEAGVVDARKAAERASAAIVEWDAGVTVSFGLAAWPESGGSKEEILKAAEMELNGTRLVVGKGETKRLEAVAPPPDEESADAAPAAPLRSSGSAARLSELEQTNQQLRKRQRQLELANTVGARIDGLFDPEEICCVVATTIQEEFNFYMIEIDQQSASGAELVRIAGAGRAYADVGQGLEIGRHRPIGTGLTSRVVRSGEALSIEDIKVEPYCFVTEAVGATRAELCVPIRTESKVWGALYLSEPRVAAFDGDDLQMASSIAEKIGAALHKSRLYGELEGAYVATVEALSGALEAKDSYVATHAREMAEKAVLVARQLDLDKEQLRAVRYGALFHDIGKIAISSEILNKPNSLTDQEFDEIGRHTVIGEQILAPVPFLKDVLPIVRHAHERWDGAGYPDGLHGEEIPHGARIVFVCDAYSAMTSERPYRSAMSKALACEELVTCAGSQFDPAVVEAFLAAVGHEHSVTTD